MRHFTKGLAMLAAGVLLSLSCSAQGHSRQTKGESKMSTKQQGKALVVHFSHAGENYGVGNIKVGNTKLVAREICKVKGADEFEIVPEKSYDMPYRDLTRLAKEEAERGEKPAFKGGVKNLEQYSTIYIGGPIWWGTYPRVMFTFFSKYDLNGKTIIPFSTHEGSGLGSVVSDLKKIYPKAKFGKAFSIYGHECQKDLSQVDKWLRE